MTQAYVVYTLLLIFLLLTSSLYSKVAPNRRSIVLILSIFVCSVVIGLRYNVGVDFLNYEYIYTHQYFDEVENGYALLNKVLYSLGLSSSSIFILVAFLQLFFFAKGVESLSPKYLPFAFFFYFATLYFFLSLNVLRQTLTFSIFVFSIRFIVNKQLIKYILTILLASTIHKSALTLLPFYFIINNDWLLKHRIIQIAGYITTYIMALILSEYIWSNFETLAVISGYADYADSLTTISEIEWAKEGGLGVYLWMLIDLWVILYYSKLRDTSPTKHDVAFYNLYYVGLLLTNIIAGSYLDRANIYFQNFRILVYAIFFYEVFMRKNKIAHRIIAIAVILVLIIFFYMGIYNKASQCAPFQFV